jgi:hypothetical protein
MKVSVHLDFDFSVQRTCLLIENKFGQVLPVSALVFLLREQKSARLIVSHTLGVAFNCFKCVIPTFQKMTTSVRGHKHMSSHRVSPCIRNREWMDTFRENHSLFHHRLYSPFLDPGRFFAFVILYTFCRTPLRGISPSQVLYLHRTAQTQNKRKQTFMPQVRFEPTAPVFELAKTVHVSDHAAPVIDRQNESAYSKFKKGAHRHIQTACCSPFQPFRCRCFR